MDATLKIIVRQNAVNATKNVLALLEAIKNDHPNLFQQVEMVIDA